MKKLLVQESSSQWEQGKWEGYDPQKNEVVVRSYSIKNVLQFAEKNGFVVCYGEKRDLD